MPLTAGLRCWGDLGRYEANNLGLPTLSEYAYSKKTSKKQRDVKMLITWVFSPHGLEGPIATQLVAVQLVAVQLVAVQLVAVNFLQLNLEVTTAL
eukprot:scaffold32181_cov51-Phaeocystis_antarctica.AAC.1